jgi:hypothetical protein
MIHLQLLEAKAEMKEKIAHISDYKSVTRLLLDTEALKNVSWDNENEFSLYGNQFDIIEKHWENDKLVINCFSDSKETLLINEYFNKCKNREGSDTTPSITLLKLINTQFLVSNQILLAGSKGPIQLIGSSYLFSLPSAYKIIPTPPPQI